MRYNWQENIFDNFNYLIYSGNHFFMTSTQNISTNNSWEIKLLYDSECPLCMKEVNFLRRKDDGQGKVCFVDIADENYLPADNANISYQEAMEKIHAILPDGTIVVNMEVFQQVYEILGMGWVYGFIKVPILGKIANYFYGIWAKLRLKLTGREDLVSLMAKRNDRLEKTGKITCQ